MKNKLIAICGAVAMLCCSAGWAAAPLAIVNGDPAGFGFNDPTPVAPVGGNTGTTLGAQRL
ncbi:MAG: peptidase, partial [Duganella sp.]